MPSTCIPHRNLFCASKLTEAEPAVLSQRESFILTLVVYPLGGLLVAMAWTSIFCHPVETSTSCLGWEKKTPEELATKSRAAPAAMTEAGAFKAVVKKNISGGMKGSCGKVLGNDLSKSAPAFYLLD